MKPMLSVDPKDIHYSKFHGYLLGAVTPRPIAFASTIDQQGQVNLSPFSFFNCFGANPPILVFSPARRGRDNTVKHTYENVLDVPEVVISMVSYSMVQQASLASTEYPKGVNEFIKAGFTEEPSLLVKPPRVKESPVSMECKVLQVIPTGDQGAAGNLVICEIVMMHISETVLDEEGKIDPQKMDVVARLGGDWYARIQGSMIFKVPKPLEKRGIGVDQIPERIRLSKILSGNDLGLLGNVEEIPEAFSEKEVMTNPSLRMATEKGEDALHQLAKEYLEQGNIVDAWKVLISRG